MFLQPHPRLLRCLAFRICHPALFIHCCPGRVLYFLCVRSHICHSRQHSYECMDISVMLYCPMSMLSKWFIQVIFCCWCVVIFNSSIPTPIHISYVWMAVTVHHRNVRARLCAELCRAISVIRVPIYNAHELCSIIRY